MPPGRQKTTFPTFGNGNPNATSFPTFDGGQKKPSGKAASWTPVPSWITNSAPKSSLPVGKSKSKSVRSAPLEKVVGPHLEPAKPYYHKTSRTPFYPGQKPTYMIPAGRAGAIPVYTYGKGKAGPSGDDSTQLNSAQLSEAARIKYANEGGAVGSAVRGVATSLVPKTLVDIGQGKHVSGKGVVSDLGNLALNLAPEGKAAAGLFGGFKGLKGIKIAAKIGRDAREAAPIEEAAAGVYKSSRHAEIQAAVDELTGKAPSQGVQLPMPLTNDAKKEVRQSLTGATKARREQDVLYSQERGKRASAAQTAMQEQGGLSGYKAGLGKLKGELPKLKFGGFENFDQKGLDALLTHIQDHPQLRTYEKIRTQGAILNVLQGKVPTKSELRLLHTVFGSDVASRIHDSIPFWKRAKNAALETLNVPRSLMSSFDLSAPFRQGLVVGVTHPKLFFKNFAPMVKAFGSENVYRSIMEDIVSRPTYGEMKDAKVALTDLGSLDTREEQFMSNYAEHIPGIGRVVRASDRAYVGFLNKTRADLFDYLLESAHGQGISTTDTRVLESIGKFVNSATGRGDLGAFQKHAVTLNTLLFSPRLLFSRLNFMNPVYYARLDPFARREALKAGRNLVATMAFVLYVAKLAGAKVNDDPRNADFAKIKLGNTRIDLAGGFQQPVRLLAQLFSGKIVSSTTGKTLTLGPQGPGRLSRRDIMERFVEGKLGPVPSVVNDFFKGTDFQGQPFSFKKEAYSHMLPLLSQDAADLYHQEGAKAAVAGYAFGSLGFGLQTYGKTKPKGKFVPTKKSTGVPASQIPSANLKGTTFPAWKP